MTDLQKDHDRTLAWVNKIRVGFGDPPLDELLTGVVGSSLHCSLAHSVGHKSQVGLYRVTYYTGRGDLHRSIRVPRYARRFIKAFDGIGYPTLVVDRQKRALGMARPPREDLTVGQ